MHRDGPSTLDRGLGVTAGLDPGRARELAAQAAALGYRALWANDEPTAPGLETLARFADGDPTLELGVGVLPLDRHPPERIAADVERLGLDPARLWVGVGSGPLRPPLAVVEEAVGRLRELLPPGTRIVVAAMRPRLCRLGGALADGVLLNWMPPTRAAQARELVREGAAEVGRPAPLVASYVRTAVGPGHLARLQEEEGRYRLINEGHRRHFAGLGLALGRVGVGGDDGAAVQAGLAPYHDALDLPIVRVLADDDEAQVRAVAAAAAPTAAVAPR
ncbi:LLM class flavin-dependent oxidoreductase [Patulibacter defluvii]|uniref:LLM class flavin-dependent oxidoreductase n=1 Tax=Patulibacter defluvii TaxID=3095358 RepID=UPI002A75D6CA|nr:LLM class flavin-dependent oxidoreductase [Patulibacter sp. DM4]